jgi:Protein of unknown function (DUF1573)
MKAFFGIFMVGALFCMASCSTSSTTNTNGAVVSDSARIVFEKPNHDFGEINEGEVVSTVYKFKNLGSMPLEIYSVDVTCGCTVAEKPEKPIGAGQSGEIKVEFSSSGKSGINKKYVTVVSNAVNSTEQVSFDVIVNKLTQE